MAKKKSTIEIQDIDDYLLSKDKKAKKKADKEKHEARFKKSLAKARVSDEEEKEIEESKLKTGNYSLRTKIIKNPWVKEGAPAQKAVKWLFTEVFKQPDIFAYRNKTMYQGGLFMFEYFNPKYKDVKSVLPWFDKYPLVLSLAPVVTALGVRNLGFNLHLLPPKIRIVVLCAVFDFYKKAYRHQIFLKKNTPVKIQYYHIVKMLEKYGVKFCLRMYIPSRQKQIVRFPINQWYKAIFIPSRGYDSIKAAALIKEWKKFCKNKGFSQNENINWTQHI